MIRQVRHLYSLLPAPGSLARRGTTMASWLLVGTGLQMMLRLGSNLIMTRLLVPEAFGLMALVFTLHTGLVMMSDLGLQPSVVRSDHGEKPRFLRTAWTLQLLQGLVLSGLLMLVALTVAWAQRAGYLDGDTVYADPLLPGLLAASVVVLMLQGLRPMTVALANRNMAIGRVMGCEIAGQIVAITLMVIIALQVPSVWALMAGSVAGAAVNCLLVHLIVPGPRMALAWDRGHIREIWSFGRWLLLGTFATFIGGRGLAMLVGALLNATAFGVFTIANIMLQMLVNVLRRIVSAPMLSMLSESRRTGDPDAYIATVARYQKAVAGSSVAVFVLASLVSSLLIDTLYDPRYTAAGAFLGLMCLNAAVGSIGAPYQQALIAEGRSDLHANVMLCYAIFHPLAALLGFHFFGAMGLLMFLGISEILVLLIVFKFAENRGHVRVWLNLLFFVPIAVVYIAQLLRTELL